MNINNFMDQYNAMLMEKGRYLVFFDGDNMGAMKDKVGESKAALVFKFLSYMLK